MPSVLQSMKVPETVPCAPPVAFMVTLPLLPKLVTPLVFTYPERTYQLFGSSPLRLWLSVEAAAPVLERLTSTERIPVRGLPKTMLPLPPPLNPQPAVAMFEVPSTLG